MPSHAENAAAAMAHAKALEPVVQQLAAIGITSSTRIARALNHAGHPAIKGGLWTPSQVEILLQRLDLVPFAGRTSNSAALRARADARARALAPLITEICADGAGAFDAIARQLNKRNIQTSLGNSWTGSSVRYLMLRLKNL